MNATAAFTGAGPLTRFTVRRDRVRIAVWIAAIVLLVLTTVASVKGLYPNQEFVHVDSRQDDVRWLDYSRSGESAGARYFGRPATDELQPDAPRLAYDAVRTPRDIAIALR